MTKEAAKEIIRHAGASSHYAGNEKTLYITGPNADRALKALKAIVGKGGLTFKIKKGDETN